MRDRVTNDQKAPEPDKKEIIEPLVYQVTGSAVTYGVDWASTVEIDGVVGWWRSSQRGRSHYPEWIKLVDSAPQGRVHGNSYYFSHQEGVEACQLYRERVLAGELRARQDSWGSSHAEATKMGFVQLKEKYPELYKAPSARKETTTVDNSTWTDPYIDRATTDRLIDDLKAEDLDELDEIDAPIAEETLASAVMVEDPKESFGMYQYEDGENKENIVLGGYISRERVSEDCHVVRLDDNKDHDFYKVYIEQLDRWMFLELGEWEINGVSFNVEVED